MSTTAAATPSRGPAAPTEALLEDPPARLVMVPIEPSEVPLTMPVATALHALRERGTDHLVLRSHGRLCAVCEVDLLRHLLEAGVRPARMLDPVSSIANPVPTVDPELRRSRVAELMLAHDDTLLLVVSDGEARGLLDARTVLRSLAGRDHRPTP